MTVPVPSPLSTCVDSSHSGAGVPPPACAWGAAVRATEASAENDPATMVRKRVVFIGCSFRWRHPIGTV
ncbi:MAG TPA: hypothetical protein DCR14_15175 [Acidimicrobiaceae bacterium]|nr:hypothetical protein [Acidimicrobiaceae bacterium]